MRLIDADKLLNKVENSMKNNPHKDIGIKRNHDTEHEHFINLICQSNTVYAPDKIIEQLLSESICARVDNDPFIMLDEAIRIVNNGGVNDLAMSGISISYIKNMARDMGCLIPGPLGIEDFKDDSAGLPDNVLLDEACVGIGNALNAYLRTNVIAATMTDLLREHYDRMRKRSNPFFPLNLEVKHEL